MILQHKQHNRSWKETGGDGEAQECGVGFRVCARENVAHLFPSNIEELKNLVGTRKELKLTKIEQIYEWMLNKSVLP